MTTNFAADHLRSFIERVERLDSERQTITDDIKDVLAEARSAGFDVKIIRKVLRLRKMDATKREEEEAVLDLYLSALGMQMDLPLEDAA